MLSAKEKALIGLGAAIAAGCQPCASSLIRAARAAGACERGIRLAVEAALDARASATEAMGLWAAAEQGSTPVIEDAFRLEKGKILSLVTAAAAYAANSTATLDRELENARGHDWADGQIAEALAVGSTVAETAAAKIAIAASRRGLRLTDSDNSCCNDEQRSGVNPSRVSSECGCASAERNQ